MVGHEKASEVAPAIPAALRARIYDRAATLALVRSPRFTSADGPSERRPLTCVEGIEEALDGYAEAYAPYWAAYREWDRWADNARRLRHDGLLDERAIPDDVRAARKAADDAHWGALERLDVLLTAEAVTLVREAACLAGVTDPDRMDEIARMVIHGDPRLGPGDSFGRERRAVALATEETPPTEAGPTGGTDALTCPHCGHETAPGLRCDVCRRHLV